MGNPVGWFEIYVQDMARADWERPRGHWIDATAAFYVKGSRKHGSMGPTLASFAQEADARAFASLLRDGVPYVAGAALAFAALLGRTRLRTQADLAALHMHLHVLLGDAGQFGLDRVAAGGQRPGNRVGLEQLMGQAEVTGEV